MNQRYTEGPYTQECKSFYSRTHTTQQFTKNTDVSELKLMVLWLNYRQKIDIEKQNKLQNWAKDMEIPQNAHSRLFKLLIQYL